MTAHICISWIQWNYKADLPTHVIHTFMLGSEHSEKKDRMLDCAIQKTYIVLAP